MKNQTTNPMKEVLKTLKDHEVQLKAIIDILNRKETDKRWEWARGQANPDAKEEEQMKWNWAQAEAIGGERNIEVCRLYAAFMAGRYGKREKLNQLVREVGYKYIEPIKPITN